MPASEPLGDPWVRLVCHPPFWMTTPERARAVEASTLGARGFPSTVLDGNTYARAVPSATRERGSLPTILDNNTDARAIEAQVP